MTTARFRLLGVFLLMAARTMGQTSDNPKSGQAVLREPVALTIKTTGGQKGSATFPKGRHVQVVETSGERSKISVANLAEGWVDNSTLELITPDTEEIPPSVSAGGNAHDSQARVEQTTDTTAAGTAVKLKKPYVRTEIDIQEGEVTKPEGGGCYDQKLTYNYKVVLSGITPEEQQLYKANTFVVVEEENMRNRGERRLKMVALRELEDAKNSFNYYATDWKCSCCKWLNRKIVGHAVLVKDMQGSVITTYKTDLGKREQEFLEEQIGQAL